MAFLECFTGEVFFWWEHRPETERHGVKCEYPAIFDRFPQEIPLNPMVLLRIECRAVSLRGLKSEGVYKNRTEEDHRAWR
jgi:hypothetical protein